MIELFFLSYDLFLKFYRKELVKNYPLWKKLLLSFPFPLLHSNRHIPFLQVLYVPISRLCTHPRASLCPLSVTTLKYQTALSLWINSVLHLTILSAFSVTAFYPANIIYTLLHKYWHFPNYRRFQITFMICCFILQSCKLQYIRKFLIGQFQKPVQIVQFPIG